MSPHCTLVVPSYCLGLDWVGQIVQVAQVGYDEESMEALKQEVGLFEVSTLVRSCPIKEIEVDMAEKEG